MVRNAKLDIKSETTKYNGVKINGLIKNYQAAILLRGITAELWFNILQAKSLAEDNCSNPCIECSQISIHDEYDFYDNLNFNDNGIACKNIWAEYLYDFHLYSDFVNQHLNYPFFNGNWSYIVIRYKGEKHIVSAMPEFDAFAYHPNEKVSLDIAFFRDIEDIMYNPGKPLAHIFGIYSLNDYKTEQNELIAGTKIYLRCKISHPDASNKEHKFGVVIDDMPSLKINILNPEKFLSSLPPSCGIGPIEYDVAEAYSKIVKGDNAIYKSEAEAFNDHLDEIMEKHAKTVEFTMDDGAILDIEYVELSGYFLKQWSQDMDTLNLIEDFDIDTDGYYYMVPIKTVGYSVPEQFEINLIL